MCHDFQQNEMSKICNYAQTFHYMKYCLYVCMSLLTGLVFANKTTIHKMLGIDVPYTNCLLQINMYSFQNRRLLHIINISQMWYIGNFETWMVS